MSGSLGGFADLILNSAVTETLVDVLLCGVTIWVAVMVGLVIGWSWRPRWSGLLFLGERSKLKFLWTVAPPGLGARRLWLAFTALSTLSVCRRFWWSSNGKGTAADRPTEMPAGGADGSCHSSLTSEKSESECDTVTEKDLEHFLHLLDGKVGDAAWQIQMERTTPNMSYQAWRYDPGVAPIIYHSRTVFEDAIPELVRNFFWDDDFRPKWDSMLAYSKILEEFHESGTMIVHWIKKFPFFCSDREYIIGRRIWESPRTYYCVTKGVPYSSLPNKNERPRRVEVYFSSWRIRAVESRKRDGQHSACEVTLIHYEDMGIPKDIAKLGVRHAMWGAVKKLHSGMRAYQLLKKTETSLSRSALMAHITTKIPDNGTITLLSLEPSTTIKEANFSNDTARGIDWKWVVIGGVALVCGLQTGIIGKALMFGAARRLGRK